MVLNIASASIRLIRKWVSEFKYGLLAIPTREDRRRVETQTKEFEAIVGKDNIFTLK